MAQNLSICRLGLSSVTAALFGGKRIADPGLGSDTCLLANPLTGVYQLV
jgi:hypothetical protein